MCKYAMSPYKSHYACFGCRKTFKRRLLWDINRDDKRTVAAKCPQCGGLMANMGMDFAAPKMDDRKAWEHMQTLYTAGITFHSCGCTGPGYIPATKERLIAYFRELIDGYNRELSFWRQREEPTNERERNREKSKHWDFIRKVPRGIQPNREPVTNEEARQYWLGRIAEIEQKIKHLVSDRGESLSVVSS